MVRLRTELLATVLGSALLAGCAGGHGEYTSELQDESTRKMAMIRAAADYDLAHQQFKGGDLKRALATIDTAHSVNDQVPGGHLLRGRILLEQGDVLGALGSFGRGLELTPEDPEFHYFCGLCYERLGNRETALARYRRAIGFDPSAPQYVLAAAEVLMELNRLAEARELLAADVAGGREQAGFRQALGHIAMMEGRLDDASGLFTEAVVLSPNDPVLSEDLIRALIASRRFAEAETALGLLLATHKAEPRRDLMHLHAACLLEIDRPVEAREILHQLTQETENDVEAWGKLADVALILKDSRMMQQVSARLIAVAPDRHEGYLSLAMVQRQQGDLEQALKNLDLAVERAGASVGPERLRDIVRRQLKG